MKITVLSGSGRYQDRWHDFTATSVEVAKALEALTDKIAVRSLKPQGVRDVRDTDLLVVNSGLGRYSEIADGNADEWAEAFATLREYRTRGGPILALHSAANSLDGLDEWPRWIGGRWDRERSMHPPIAEARVHVTDHRHPITHELADFTLLDELYSYLEVDPESNVLLNHSFEGSEHPLVWTLERDGARSVYDALGHDVRSFASAERVDLLRREAHWLLRW
jgi:type 1 glutamine amidotransferase